MNRLANAIACRPRLIALVGALLIGVAAGIGGPLPGLLGSGDDFDDPGSEAARAVAAVTRSTGTAATPDVLALVPTPGGATQPGGRSAVDEVATRLADVPGVVRVVGPSQGGAGLVARDGSSALVLAYAAEEGDIDSDTAQAAVAGTRAVLGGSQVAQGQVGEQVQEDLLRAELIAMPLLFLLALWVFRSPVAALLPVLVGGATVMGTFFVLRLVNGGVYELSVFALNLVTGLGLGLAVDYSLLMVSRFREELGRVGDARAAAAATVRTAGRTILFSALTVATALLSLTVFPQRFLKSMGIAGAVVPLVAFAVTVTVLAAVLALLGRRVDALVPARLVRREPADDEELHRTRWYRLSRWVLGRPGRVAAGAATLLILVGLPFFGVRFVAVDATVLPSTHSARVVADAVARDFPVDVAAPIVIAVTTPTAQRDDVVAYRADVESLLGDRARISAPTSGSGVWTMQVVSRASQLDDETKQVVRDIRALETPLDVSVGGATARFLDQQSVLGARIPLALAILVATTLLLLFLMTGSVVLPVKAVLMNLLTVCATFGLLVLIFQDGRFTGLLDYEPQGALEATQPVLLFAIAFALSTDYGTFLLARILEARRAGADDREAVAVGLARTGRIVTAAALLLVVAIGAFATSEIVFIKLLGVGAALSVIIDATIVRALLVPALMALLGRANWYAPAPLRRLHARLALQE